VQEPGSKVSLDDPHLSLVEAYFDENAGDWDDLYGRAQRVNDLVLADRKEAAIGHLTAHLAPGARILDAGCGAGLASADLLERGYSVVGVDVSQKMIDHARKNFESRGFPAERWDLHCAGIEEAQLEAGSFAGIAALGVLQYQDDEAAALRECHRLLEPGGLLVITGPTRLKLANWLGLSRYYYGLRRRLKGLRSRPAPPAAPAASAEATKLDAGSEAVLFKISAHSYSYGRFRRLLTEAGFEVVSGKGHGYVNFDLLSKRLGFKGQLFLHRFFSGVAKVLPIGRWANDLIFVARKPR
jgi:SAM-dependent methyltransferase